MKHRILTLFIVAALAILTVIPVFAKRGHGAPGVVCVGGQDLYYDILVSAKNLSVKGLFQLSVGSETEFGPGYQGHVGGHRWIEDGNGILEEDDDTFLRCPLPRPVRTSP